VGQIFDLLQVVMPLTLSHYRMRYLQNTLWVGKFWCGSLRKNPADKVLGKWSKFHAARLRMSPGDKVEIEEQLLRLDGWR
jgi:hypothetical protein